jgi:hypothetical protein
MPACVYSVFVLSYVQVAALRRTHHSSKESYLLCIDYGTEKAPKARKGCGAIEEEEGGGGGEVYTGINGDNLIFHSYRQILHPCFIN